MTRCQKLYSLVIFSAIYGPNFMSAQKLSVSDAPPPQRDVAARNAAVTLVNERTINTRQLEFSPAFFEDGIVFISSQKPLSKEKIFDARIESGTMSIFLARRDQNGQLEKPEAFASSLVSALHEGPLTFDKSANNVYFSRNNSENNGKTAKYTEGVSRLKIYTAKRQGETNWGLPTELSFDEDNSDACHPSISDDGEKLYFASNRTGGYGGMDIYVCERTKTGWGKPRNLGPKINTSGNELFPFVHADGTLFYSSNGLSKSGGLDIFCVKWNDGDLPLFLSNKKGKSGIGLPVNLGGPFNSDKDDFGFILDMEGKRGYLTSNRSGGVGSDDIYSFDVNQTKVSENADETTENTADTEGVKTDKNESKNEDKSEVGNDVKPRYRGENEPKTKGKQVNILVVDRQTGKPISAATTAYLNLNDLSISDVILGNNGKQAQFVKSDGTFDLDVVAVKLLNKQTNVSGKAQIATDKKGSYVINITKKGYFSEQITIKQGDLREDIVVLLNQSANQSYSQTSSQSYSQPFNQTSNQSFSQSSGQPLRNVTLREGQSFKLNNVYYDYDDATIRPDAARDLNTLYALMMKYPDMEVELSAHTDARGTPAYNLDLSQRRAESAVRYLVSKGIDNQRVRAIGYGEMQLKNHCASGDRKSVV